MVWRPLLFRSLWYVDIEYSNLGAGVWVGARVDPLSALGVTKAKRRVSKKTGIPLSRGGRRMKLGKWLGMK